VTDAPLAIAAKALNTLDLILGDDPAAWRGALQAAAMIGAVSEHPEAEPAYMVEVIRTMCGDVCHRAGAYVPTAITLADTERVKNLIRGENGQ